MLTDRESTTPELDPLKIYFNEVSKHPLLSKTEERQLTERVFWYGNEQAVQRLVLSNLRLVVKIALKYSSHYADPLDLIQEGNMGLMRGVRKYNPYRNTSLATYVSFWIRAAILKHVLESWSLVKIGTNQSERKLFFSLNEIKNQLADAEADAHTIAASLKASEKDIEHMEMRLSSPDISLDQPSSNGDQRQSYGEQNWAYENVEEIVTAKEKRELLKGMLSQFKQQLSQRDRFIFEKRIIAEDPVTLQRIGDQFGITRERVRQMETTIKTRLKRHLKQGVFILNRSNSTSRSHEEIPRAEMAS